jgi:hypothetical protein
MSRLDRKSTVRFFDIEAVLIDIARLIMIQEVPRQATEPKSICRRTLVVLAAVISASLTEAAHYISLRILVSSAILVATTFSFRQAVMRHNMPITHTTLPQSVLRSDTPRTLKML